MTHGRPAALVLLAALAAPCACASAYIRELPDGGDDPGGGSGGEDRGGGGGGGSAGSGAGNGAGGAGGSGAAGSGPSADGGVAREAGADGAAAAACGATGLSCNPMASSSGCPAGQGCYVSFSAGAVIASCAAAGIYGAGLPCIAGNDCTPGNVCVKLGGGLLGLAGATCMPLCCQGAACAGGTCAAICSGGVCDKTFGVCR